jgi:hypothetical protein
MLFEKTHIFLIDPTVIQQSLGSGNEAALGNAQTILSKSELPEEVQAHVLDTLNSWLQKEPTQQNLDLIGTLALITLVGSLADPMDLESLEELTNVHGIFQNLTELMEYNAMTHLFGNPPAPFQTVDTTGTTLDVGHLDTVEVENFYDELVHIEITEEDLDAFSDEHGFDLWEELLAPIQEVLEIAMDRRQDVIFVTAD